MHYGLPKHLLIEKLQSVQNAATRVTERVSKYEHITPMLQELHWLPVEYRIIFKINLLTFKCLHNAVPSYLLERLETYKPATSLCSFSALLMLKRVKYNYYNIMVTYGLRSFLARAPLLWNGLPPNVRSADTCSLLLFKARLKILLDCEQSLFLLISRRARFSRLCRSRITRSRLLFPADFRAKERLLAVYIGIGQCRYRCRNIDRDSQLM